MLCATFHANYEAVGVPLLASVGNSLTQSATMSIVPTPPITADGTVPNHAAVRPDSNSPVDSMRR